MNHRTISRHDDEWPELLNELGPYAPPRRLYVAGLPLSCGARSIAVVGARDATVAGVEAAGSLAAGLAEAGFTIVSGLAVGIDGAAHRAALAVGGYTVAVVGGGLDVAFPRPNRALRSEILERGTLVSEYPLGVRPRGHHFPERNRIIAGMAAATLVVEGGVRSGSLITARVALDANRSVFAVPGSVRNSAAAGSNELIRTSRAALVTDICHIFEELAPEEAWGDRPVDPGHRNLDLGETERKVLMALDDVPTPAGRLGQVVDMTDGATALALSKLEIRGFAGHRSAGYFISQTGASVRAALKTR